MSSSRFLSSLAWRCAALPAPPDIVGQSPFRQAPARHHEKHTMLPIPPGMTCFDEDDVKTVAFGQTIGLDWSALLPAIDRDSAAFSGKLILHAAGGGMNEYFSLDTEDGRITFTQSKTAFYTETLVHIDGAYAGSYVDLGIGPYFKMNLQDAGCEHVEVLLRHMEFTAGSGSLSSDRPGPRTITVELQEQSSGQKAIAQTMINVITTNAVRDLGTTGFSRRDSVG